MVTPAASKSLIFILTPVAYLRFESVRGAYVVVEL